MKIKRISVFPYLSNAQRDILEEIKPWHKSYWGTSKKFEINGVDYTERLKEIKKSISEGLNDQNLDKCTFCSSQIGVTSDFSLDHFLPKYKYPEFTYEIENLYLVCEKCNKSTRKGKKNPISRYSRKYSKCSFKIYHPRYDDPERHFEYIAGASEVIIQGRTRKGRRTITFFKLYEPRIAEDRAKSFVWDELQSPQYAELLASILDRVYTR